MENSIPNEIKDKKKILKEKKPVKGKKEKKIKKKKSKKIISLKPISQVPLQKDPFGAGGLPGFLEALGVKGKFQSMGGSTGFSQLQPQNTPVGRPQYAAPKLEDKTIIKEEVAKIISPQQSIETIDSYLKKLERSSQALNKDQLVEKVNAYFGDEGLDYIVKDEILQNKTKRGILRNIADFIERGYGNIDLNDFMSFNPQYENVLSIKEVEREEPNYGMVQGESTSDMGKNGFAEETKEGEVQAKED